MMQTDINAMDRGRAIGLPVGVLFALVLGVFLPALGNGFINLDDGVYVTDNPQVQAGLTVEGLRWAFRTFDSANWHPLTWLSLMLDAELFGAQEAWGFHLTSVVLHALNAVLVFWLLRRLTGSTWRSAMVAAFFGLHPLRVESVAWVSERKDVLSTFFGLLSLLAYERWRGGAMEAAPRRRAVCGVLSWCALALGLMSKPMLVTLPCVMLLLDFWPLRRTDRTLAGWGRLVREKIPFFLLAAGGAVSTWVAQASLGAMGNATAYPFLSRAANALKSYAAYLGATFWPVDLAVIYPFRIQHETWTVVAAGLLLGAVTAGVVWRRREQPSLLVGWLWFLGTLVPVIGLVQVGGQARADRYTYLPAIGLAMAVVWGWTAAVASRRSLRWVSVGLAVAAVAGLSLATVRQIARWRDSETLFRHALSVTQDNYFAHNCLALALIRSPDRRDEAIEQFRAAVRVVPGLPEARLKLAAALAEAGPEALAESAAEYRKAVRLDPSYVDALLGLARVSMQLPDGLEEATASLRRVLELVPENADARYGLAECLAQSPASAGEALREYREAARLQPEQADIRTGLGLCLARSGRFTEAIAEYEAALRAKPDHAEAHNNLANVLVRLEGRGREAIAHYRRAVVLRPEYWEAHFNLGLALAADDAGRDEASTHFEAVLRLRPDFAPAQQMLTELRGE